MPILTEPYSNPKWGFLHGLGESPDAPIWLYNGPDGQFSGARFEELKSIVYSALSRADQQVNELEKLANENVHWYTPEILSPAESAAKVILASIPQTRANLARYRREIDAAVGNLSSVFWSGLPAVTGVTPYQQLISGIQIELQGLADQRGVLDWSADNSFFASLLARALEMVKEAYDYVGKAASESLKRIEDAADAINANLGAGLWFLKNWYWLAIGAGVIFYVVPTVIRTRREGAKALEEDLRAGRARLESGARKAGAVAKVALLGSPKRRNRK